MGIPQNRWFVMEHPTKMGDLGVAPLMETPNGCLNVFFWRTLNGKLGKYETRWAAGALLAISAPTARLRTRCSLWVPSLMVVAIKNAVTLTHLLALFYIVAAGKSNGAIIVWNYPIELANALLVTIDLAVLNDGHWCIKQGLAYKIVIRNIWTAAKTMAFHAFGGVCCLYKPHWL